MNDLLALNVNDRIEKKGGLAYLSWAWAWAEVLKFDPTAEWEFHRFNAPDGTTQPCMWIGDTAMVQTTVTIKRMSRSCMLPVMDNKNNAVKNPDARKISDAIMRCMTKAIAMHGLGLYIYAGEDLPQMEAEPDPEDEARAKRGEELEEFALVLIDMHEQGHDLKAIEAYYDPKNWSADNPTEMEERKYLWGKLPSKLRSTLKSNHPERLAEKKAA